MRGLWLEDRQLRLRDDLPDPEAAAGEAVVRVTLAGICGTDLALLKGYLAFRGVPGHEFVGSVESAPGREDLIGSRVVAEINLGCGSCESCGSGVREHCETRQVLGLRGRDGALAERLLVPIRNLHPVPDQVSDEAAVFTEPLAAALRVTQQVPVGPGSKALVIGDGRLGQLLIRALIDRGVEVHAISRHARKRALLEAAGARNLEPSALRPRSFSLVLEATGRPEGFALAREAVRPRGTLVLKTTCAGTTPIDLASLVVDEVTLVGSRCGPFDSALELLGRGLDPRDLIDGIRPLSEALDAFDLAFRPGTLKLLVRC